MIKLPTEIAPSPSRVFLTARWESLVMLNFAIEPNLLEPLVPAGTELDLWQGEALISVVGFRFLQTRIRGLSVPFHRDFDEVNLRFYVRRRGPEGWRRGVAFIKEVVPRRAIALVARRIYNENYVALPMRSTVKLPHQNGGQGQVKYRWRGATWMSVGATFENAPQLPAENSEQHFIAEHYWGYAQQRDGGTVEYRVDHPPWRVWNARSHRLFGDFGAFYGQPFADAFSQPPRSCFVARGSDVTVFSGHRIR